MNKLINFIQRDNSKVLIGNLLASFFGLLNFVLMVKIMTKSEFGIAVMFFSAAGFADLIRTGFIRQGLVRQWEIGEGSSEGSLIGSAWVMHILIGAVMAALCYLAYFGASLFSFENQYFIFLIAFYPLLLLTTIPHQMESWLAQSKKQYIAMNIFRLVLNILFSLILLWYWYFDGSLSIYEVLFYNAACNGIVSVVSLVYFRSIKNVFIASKHQLVALFNFGKFSLSTLAGSNLLKSTDTLLIGLLMGSEYAAIYAVPFKVIELLEIPLRGFVMTSFQTLTRLYKQEKYIEYYQHFRQNVFKLTLAFLPIVIICLVVPSWIIALLGASDYGESILILQVISIAMFLLPIDKFAGVALDSNNQPHQNALKVWLMVAINFFGDLMVIWLGGPLWMIAAVTIANIAFGIFYGIYKNEVLRSSFQFQRSNWSDLKL